MTSALIAALAVTVGLTVGPTRTVSAYKVNAIAPRPAVSQYAAAGEDFVVRLVNAVDGSTIRSFSGHPQPVYAIGFNAAGTLMATGDETARIFIWNVSTGAKVREFTRIQAHTRGIQSVAFSPDGKQIVTTGRDDFMIVWDVATGRPIKKIPGEGANVASGVWGPKATVAYCCTLSEGVRAYARSTWGLAATMKGHEALGATAFCTNPAGTLGASGGRDNSINIWSLTTRQRVRVIKGHEDWVLNVAFAPNGRVLASSSSDRTVRLWDATSGASLGKFDNQSAVGAPIGFTGDGKFLISVDSNENAQIRPVTGASSAPAGGKTKKRRR
jgi:WD40 repeat protein